MNPSIVILRLALSALLNAAACILGAVMWLHYHDTGSAIACAAGLALAGSMTAPSPQDVRLVIDALREHARRAAG